MIIESKAVCVCVRACMFASTICRGWMKAGQCGGWLCLCEDYEDYIFMEEIIISAVLYILHSVPSENNNV